MQTQFQFPFGDGPTYRTALALAHLPVAPASEALDRLDRATEYKFPVLVSLKPALSEWRQLWLKYVAGFDPAHHCQRCLLGPSEGALYKRLRPGAPMALMQPGGIGVGPYDALYLCGVHASWSWAKNLHLVAIPDRGAIASWPNEDNPAFRIYGARRIEIPDLPLDHDGRSKEFTTCRNWRFGVAYYGIDPRRQEFDPLGRRAAVPA